MIGVKVLQPGRQTFLVVAACDKSSGLKIKPIRAIRKMPSRKYRTAVFNRKRNDFCLRVGQFQLIGNRRSF